jgi:hypothetical protein
MVAQAPNGVWWCLTVGLAEVMLGDDMRLPKHVVVCGYDYEVIRVTARTPASILPKDWGETTCGYFETDPIARIWIRSVPKNPAIELDSFVHEILHAVLYGSGAGRFVKREEDLLHTLTPAFIAALKSARLIR